MNLSQLRFADAVARAGSFTKAAAECRVTQPTLSNGIAQLEYELGDRLFVRTTRSVAPTPFGSVVLPYIAQVLGAQASLLQQASKFLNPEQRLLRIGTSPLISAHRIGMLLEPFRREFPNVNVVLREANMTDLQRMLESGLIDFMFGVSEIHKGSNTAFLYDEPLLFIPRGSEWHGRSSARSVQLKDITGETYVMVPDACGLSRATRALFQAQRSKLHEYPGEALSYQVLEEWAALGIGAAILPQSKITAGRQVFYSIRDLSGRPATIAFQAVWPAIDKRAKHLLGFARHLRRSKAKNAEVRAHSKLGA